MFALWLGVLGFLCYFLYDVNSVGRIAGWMNRLFMIGTILIVVATSVLFWKRRSVLFQTPMDLLWMAGGVFFLYLLIYTLFFALPFDETYVKESRYRKAYTEGVYALCRHPGVLWFAGMYLFAALLWKSLEGLIFFVVMVILNIFYVIFQDYYSFPKTFSNYREYQRSTPFLIPNRKSIQQCRNSKRGAGRK
ncbi:hypothetical protein DXB59_16755 [Ruminococcus sp. OM05-10BH]|nr:hypothetical protein DXB59_16755 [Ruminococcus sp. OM05-10BH]